MGGTSGHDHPVVDVRRPGGFSAEITRRRMVAGAALGFLAGTSGARATAPKGQLTWAAHVSLAPTWFDPAETPGIVTPFMLLYALHDGMMKAMPGDPANLSLAESHTAADGVTHEFVL